MDPKVLRSTSSSGLTSSSSNLLSDDASTSTPATTAAATTSAPAAESSSSSATAAPPVVTPTSVLEAIKEQKEWAKAVAFESDGRIVAATVKPLEGEVEYVLSLAVSCMYGSRRSDACVFADMTV